MNMRVDDIDGACAKNFYVKRFAKKVSGFFPNIMDQKN